jgi:CheY-like chemotaxis protein
MRVTEVLKPERALDARSRQLTVLIVDDDPTVRDITADVMEMAGWATLRARDGESALRHIEEHAPDVVLLDIALPRMSGLDVLRLVKSTEWRGPKPRIVLLSGYARLLPEADASLADGVVEKPFDLDDLVQKVSNTEPWFSPVEASKARAGRAERAGTSPSVF